MDNAASDTASEARIHGADAKSTKARRYYAASMFVKRLDSAWNRLDFEEQHILTEFYGQRNRHSGASRRLCDEYGLCERSIYNRCSTALAHFAEAIEYTDFESEESI